jgi:hypothetical protein
MQPNFAISQRIELLTEISVDKRQSLKPTQKNSFSATFNKNILISDQKFLSMQLSNFQTINVEKLNLKQRSTKKYSWFGHI